MIAVTGICPLVSSPLNTVRLVSACAVFFYGLNASAQELQLHIDDIVAPSFSLRGIEARLSLATSSHLNIRVAEVTLQKHVWRNLALQCLQAHLESTIIACPQGVVDNGEKIPFSFKFWPASKRLELSLQPSAGERWQALMSWRGGKLAAALEIKNGKAMRLNPWVSTPAIKFSKGVFNLSGKFDSDNTTRLEALLTLHDVAFSDVAGTHAGEKLDATVNLQAKHDRLWYWRTHVAWREGEIFWQPFYFDPGVRNLTAQGTLTDAQVLVEKAQLDWAGIGSVQFNGVWDHRVSRIEDLQLSGKSLALKGLYRTFLQPLAPDGVLHKLTLEGLADGVLNVKGGEFEEAAFMLHHSAIEHETKQFSVIGIDGSVAWQRQQERVNRISITSARFGQLEMGAFTVDAKLAPGHVSLAALRIPILDGALSVNSVEAQQKPDGWQWTLSADLQPISMQRLSQSLELPTMHGTLSAIIPQIHYGHEKLQVDGALLFKVFDGTVVVKDLSASDLFGPAPHLYANIDMLNLDLSLLTQTFSFGSIQGRLDVTVHDLEVFGWKPVRFDAKVASSAGNYPRKISQRAVENITALGGGGGTAVIQRSFLRFFDQFGYKKIGLSCHLTRGVCAMSGVSEAPTGYVIVEGGGIPALTVIGYNRTVDWNELLARLKRATQGGKPIVQ